MTLVGVLICLWFFGGLMYELLRHWQREREKQRLARKRQQEELNNWAKYYQQWKEEIEPRHRYQAGYPDDWDMRRYEVCQRAHGECESCGIQLRYPQYGTHFRLSLPIGAHVHHKIPLSKGGNNTLSNLVLLCIDCHRKEHPNNKGFASLVPGTITSPSRREQLLSNDRQRIITDAIRNQQRIEFFGLDHDVGHPSSQSLR